MFHGFYNLTSGILCQNRNLDIISNNMVNISTPGYKSEKYISSTFRNEMIYRTGNKDKSNPTELNNISMIRATVGSTTDFVQGAYEDTGGNLDFALSDPGFFVIQKEDGTNVYTRDGSFGIDNEGFLMLPGVGRVMGQNGPLNLVTDNITVDDNGNIFAKPDPKTGEETDTEETQEAELLGRLMVVDFEDYEQLTKADDGTFEAAAAGQAVNGGIKWKLLERSNVDAVDQMTAMMGSQKAIQSSAQVLKMYDQLMGRIASEIGKV